MNRHNSILPVMGLFFFRMIVMDWDRDLSLEDFRTYWMNIQGVQFDYWWKCKCKIVKKTFFLHEQGS